MIKEKEIPLKIERFQNGEESNFLIHSKAEIQQILNTIHQRNTRCALYFDGGRRFVLSMLLAASKDGIWLDPASRSVDNRDLLNSESVTFVSVHNQTKIQFVAANPWQTSYEKSAAIFLALPPSLIRLQRRDFYRLSLNPIHAPTCVLHSKNQSEHEPKVSVVDISVGGLSLAIPDQDDEWKAGHIFPDCEINLPELGTLKVALQVKNTFSIKQRNGKTQHRAGCMFIQHDHEAEVPLQRYVNRMQLQAASAFA